MDISNLRLSTLIWSFICCLQCPAPETSNIGRGWGPMWPFLGVRGIMEKWGETSDGFRADHGRQKVLMPSHLVQGHRCRRRVFNCEIAQNEGTSLVSFFFSSPCKTQCPALGLWLHAAAFFLPDIDTALWGGHHIPYFVFRSGCS